VISVASLASRPRVPRPRPDGGWSRGAVDPPSQAAEAGLAIEGWGEPVVDQAARAHYQRRITELKAELEEAQERATAKRMPPPVRSSTR
jgi:50S ribosomal subunit-associated GTPase HflX